MHNNELCVPASAVSGYDDATDSGVAPAEGDEVEVTIKGRVTRTEGGNVYLSPESANGEPLAKPEMAGGDQGEEMDHMMEAEKARVGYV